MNNNRYIISCLALAALTASCSKKAADAPAPAVVQDVAKATSANPQNMWTAYLDDIEAGKQKDPTGQFVSKDTRVPNGDGSSARPTRPKISLDKDPVTNLYPQPTEPIEECPGGCPGGGGPPEPSSGFFSSETIQLGVNPTDNPNDYILNLDIIKGDYDFGLDARYGFNKIPVDLNKGAGGKKIYLCFTRRSEGTAIIRDYDPEGNLNPYKSPETTRKTPVTDIYATSQGFFGTISPGRYTGYDWIYQYLGNFANNWTYPDLNDEAGGKYIYALWTKGLKSGGNGHIDDLPKTPLREVGVLYSNSDSAQPPAGWIRDPQDLNEGAGGYYIYFCIKR